jgi:ribonuclease D
MSTLITDSDTLKKRIAPLFAEAFVAVDTEFLREKTYYAQLCLIQLAGSNDAFAIDPLAKGIDLTPFYQLMDDKKVCKVFHACSQDLEIIYHEHGKLPRNVYDTQIAAQMLGFGEAVGYGNIVQDILGRELDKTSRHTDWAKRPLSAKQIDYALSDVTHLRDLYVQVQERLKVKGRDKWVQEEMEPYLDEATYSQEPKDAWRKLKFRSTKKSYILMLQALAEWRELRAQSLNKPRQWIMKNDALLEIASLEPKEGNDLKGLRFFNFSNHPDLANDIVAAMKKAKFRLAPAVEKRKHLPKGSAAVMDLLRILLKAQADRHDVAPSVIATSEELELFVCSKKPKIRAMKGWRYDVFGQYAEQLCDGKLALTAEHGSIELIEPVMLEK